MEKRASPDFPPLALTEIDAGLWLSKDIHFATLPEATSQLPLIGGLQLDVRLSASDFLKCARTATMDGVTLLVAGALDLLKEKQACCAKLERPQDFLYKTTLEAFIPLDLADRVAAAAQDPARALVPLRGKVFSVQWKWEQRRKWYNRGNGSDRRSPARKR